VESVITAADAFSFFGYFTYSTRYPIFDLLGKR
jgi:hypothetical protein